MIFPEYVDKYGMESARNVFNVGDHLVMVVHRGQRVMGVCGGWIGSEPLGDSRRNPDVETAKQRLRDALRNCFKSEETVYAEEAGFEETAVDA